MTTYHFKKQKGVGITSEVHDFRVHITKSEMVDFIVPERLREARIFRMMDREFAAEKLGISDGILGLYENGHKEIPKELLFRLEKLYHFPKNIFIKLDGKEFEGGIEVNRPCLNCQKRHLGCHSTCKEYKAFKEQLESIHEKKKEEFAVIDYLVAKDGAYGRMAKRRGVMRIG